MGEKPYNPYATAQGAIMQKRITHFCIIENQSLPSVITVEIIDESAKKLLAHKSDYYMELFDRQSQSRKQLLKALTKEGKNIFSAEYIKRHRLPAAATLQRAVKELINNGVAEKVKDEYFIADPFFKLFIAKY